MERQPDAPTGDRHPMSWDSLIRFYRFVLRFGDARVAELLTRALASEPALLPRVDRELRAAGRDVAGLPGAPDWVVRMVGAHLAAGSEPAS